MAKVIVSGNLNIYGDAGQYEADRSAWGFADFNGTILRSSLFSTLGIYSAQITYPAVGTSKIFIPCRWTVTVGKKYIVKAKVLTPSSGKIAGDAVNITLNTSAENGWYGVGTPIDIVTKTILEATDSWVDIEASVIVTSIGIGLGNCIVYINIDGAGIAAGKLYVDQFEVYEYVEEEEIPEPLPPVDQLFFSRNPVLFPKAASVGWDSLINYRLYDDVRVELEADSGTYTSKLKLALTPESTGNAIFQVREAFRDLLTAVAPTLNSETIMRLTDRIKRFKHFTGELTGETIVPGTLTESDPAIILLGGVGKYIWPTLDFFNTYLPFTKKFMTWAPIEKEVDRTQEDYLNYFVFDTDMVTINLLVKAYFDDNTNQTATIASKVVSYQQLYQLPAGPVNAGVLLINPAKTVIKYEVWVTDQADAVQSEVRTYIIDPVSDPRKRFFLFLNSLGSYEVLRFTAQAEFTTEFVKDGIVKFLPYNYAALDGEKEINNATLQESGSYGSGYLNSALSREWLDYLKDFLLSRRVYDVTDGKRRPVSIPGGSFNTGGDQNYERAIRFTLLDSYADENYTPKL